ARDCARCDRRNSQSPLRPKTSRRRASVSALPTSFQKTASASRPRAAARGRCAGESACWEDSRRYSTFLRQDSQEFGTFSRAQANTGMRNLLLLLTLVLLSTPVALADDARAQEILKQARQAIGGDEQLQKIQGLQINGQYRRVFGDRQMGGDREISILLPNKYLVEDAMNAGGLSTAMISTRALNGERAWSGNSGGGGGMIFRMSGPGGQQMSPEQMEETQRRIYNAEFSR